MFTISAFKLGREQKTTKKKMAIVPPSSLTDLFGEHTDSHALFLHLKNCKRSACESAFPNFARKGSGDTVANRKFVFFVRKPVQNLYTELILSENLSAQNCADLSKNRPLNAQCFAHVVKMALQLYDLEEFAILTGCSFYRVFKVSPRGGFWGLHFGHARFAHRFSKL